MTTAQTCPVLTAADAVSVAAALAEEFAVDADRRDLDRALPFDEITRLKSTGLLAITVPRQYGGADLPPSTVAEVVRILATVDPNIAQIPHSHFVYLNLLRLAGSERQQHEYYGHVRHGASIANAQSERGGRTAADIATTLRPAGDGFRIDGVKHYCTGSPFADILAVLTRLDDPDAADAAAGSQFVAFLPAGAAGVHIADDWDALGQRTTGSGSVTFSAVAVDRAQLVPRDAAVNAPSGYGAFAQLLHAAIDTGIARGALQAAADFVRTASRPWFEAGVTRAVDDPLLIQRFGELAVSVEAAEAVLASAGTAVDATITGGSLNPDVSRADESAAASLAVATAKVLADRSANEVSSALFEVSGTRSAGAGLNLDRFWRNARTHTLHDPIRWKYQHIGRALLHGTPPPLHGVI